MKNHMKIIFLVILMLVFSRSNAQPIQNVYVFAENADEDFIKCNLSNEGLLASARSTLRYNRISNAEIGSSDLSLYIRATVLPAGQGFCATYVHLEFYKMSPINIPKGRLWGSHVLCGKGSLTTASIQNTQTRLNDSVRSLTDKCITEIEDKLNK
jgi:hypothetical protein